MLLVGAVTVAVLASRGGDEGGETGTAAGGGTASSVGRSAALAPGARPGPGAGPGPSGGAGTELMLLAGKVVVAARPGWERLDDPGDNVGSVHLELSAPGGRALSGTLTIATLSDPSAFDTTLKLEGGTSFEVKGTDGLFRITVQPGLAARVVAGAARSKAAFYMNLSVFAFDGQEVDAPTLRTLFTDQVAPALRFP